MLGVRASEHLGFSYRTSKPYINAPKSAIADHLSTYDSNPDLSNFSVIDSCNSDLNIRILESVHIHFIKPILNLNTSAFPLKILWTLNIRYCEVIRHCKIYQFLLNAVDFYHNRQ